MCAKMCARCLRMKSGFSRVRAMRLVLVMNKRVLVMSRIVDPSMISVGAIGIRAGIRRSRSDSYVRVHNLLKEIEI
jgi:hypothetical protein